MQCLVICKSPSLSDPSSSWISMSESSLPGEKQRQLISITQRNPQPRRAAGHRKSSNYTFVQAQEELKMKRALALQRAQEKGQYPHPKEKSFSIHCEQEPCDNSRLFKYALWVWRKGATSASDLKTKLFEKHLGSVCLLSWFYPDTSSIKTHLLGLFAFHFILDKHTSISPDEGMHLQPNPRCWREREAPKDAGTSSDIFIICLCFLFPIQSRVPRPVPGPRRRAQHSNICCWLFRENRQFFPRYI